MAFGPTMSVLGDKGKGNGLAAMEKRLAGAKTNKPMKPPKKGGKQFRNMQNG